MSSFETPVQHLVVMGVCGSGKTTVAALLAQELGRVSAEADDFHPRANVEKMASGHPLTDEDRWPWLATIRDWLDEQAAAGRSGIVTCSALKRSYRDLLSQAGGRVTFVHLDGDRATLEERMASRSGHFMPATLLDSQLETLEPLGEDEDGFRLDIHESPENLVREVASRLNR
ncbi:gluconokinase [Dermabacteraceae bacterium P7074]